MATINFSEHKQKIMNAKENNVRKTPMPPPLEMTKAPEAEIDHMMENAEAKAELCANISSISFEMIRNAKLQFEFNPTEEYLAFLHNGYIEDIFGMDMPVYYAKNGEELYLVLTESEPDENEEDFWTKFALIKKKEDETYIYGDDGWEFVDMYEELNLPPELLDIYKSAGAESLLLQAYIADADKETIAVKEWEAFKKKYSKLLQLYESYPSLLDIDVIGGQAFIFPEDIDHCGIAISCEDDCYRLYQYLEEDDLKTEDQLESKGMVVTWNGVPEMEIFMKDLGPIENESDLKNIIEYHFDRNTNAGKIYTMPITKDIILHFDESILKQPERIIDITNSKDQSITTNISAMSLAAFIKRHV